MNKSIVLTAFVSFHLLVLDLLCITGTNSTGCFVLGHVHGLQSQVHFD